MRLAVSTRRSRSIAISHQSRKCGTVLAGQPDLLVPIVAPEPSMTCVRPASVLLDRLDALGRRSRDRLAFVEESIVHLGFRR